MPIVYFSPFSFLRQLTPAFSTTTHKDFQSLVWRQSWEQLVVGNRRNIEFPRSFFVLVSKSKRRPCKMQKWGLKTPPFLSTPLIFSGSFFIICSLFLSMMTMMLVFILSSRRRYICVHCIFCALYWPIASTFWRPGKLSFESQTALTHLVFVQFLSTRYF